MTSNRSETARYLAFNQGLSTSAPRTEQSSSKTYQTGFQPVVGQQYSQFQTSGAAPTFKI